MSNAYFIKSSTHLVRDIGLLRQCNDVLDVQVGELEVLQGLAFVLDVVRLGWLRV